MRHVRFRLTGLRARDLTREARPNPSSKLSAGMLVSVAVLAAAVYKLGGRGTGTIASLSRGGPSSVVVRLPDNVDFGNQQVGTSGEPRAVPLSVLAAGDAPVEIHPASLSDPESTDFAIPEDGCKAARLSAGQSCTISIRFNPRVAGEHVAVLVVPTGLGAHPLEVTLKGTGTSPPLFEGVVPTVVEQAEPHVHANVSHVTEAVPIYDPAPVYPEEARMKRVEGVVHLTGVVTKEGKVRDLKAASGDPVLAAAAIAAVSQWGYTPTMLNGTPVDDRIEIAVKFTLVPPPETPPPSEVATPPKGG